MVKTPPSHRLTSLEIQKLGGNAGSNPAAGTLGSSMPRLRHNSNAERITTACRYTLVP